MLNIYTTPERADAIAAVIGSQHRLHELVTVRDFLAEKPVPSADSIIVNAKGISLPLDWHNVAPPYLLPEHLMFDADVLLALVYVRLANYEAVHALLKGHGALLSEIDFLQRLQYGLPAEPDKLAVETYREYDDYRLMHNNAIVRQYATDQGYTDPSKLHYYYRAALEAAPTEEYRAFSAKQYALYMIDQDMVDEAEHLLLGIDGADVSPDARSEVKATLCQAWMKQLSVPYDAALLEKLKENLWEVVVYYEGTGRILEYGLVMLDAAHIANVSESMAEALGYLSKAIDIFKREGADEFYYKAQLKRAELLYAWAKKGSPHFFKAAMDSYQIAGKFFTKEDFPLQYAEIQECLGVIYSEIPEEAKKKSIWAAVSSSSFQEALGIFTKDAYPYEYARVCTSYGNALTKYPDAIHSDNFEKALFYYNEALHIRTALDFPFERSLTLLNYIEASWYANNEGNEHNPARMADIAAKIEEVIRLDCDEALVQEAQAHQARLGELRAVLN